MRNPGIDAIAAHGASRRLPAFLLGSTETREQPAQPALPPAQTGDDEVPKTAGRTRDAAARRCAILLALLGAVASPRALAQAYVRINEVGYETGQPGRAYLMSADPAGGAPFTVVAGDGTPVMSGVVGTASGTWGPYQVYPIDFSVAASGGYRISVAGPVSATSPKFVIGSPERLYRGALANALSFYRNERDGPEFIPSALRTAPGHLNDAVATVYAAPPVNRQGLYGANLSPTGETIDAGGGWWDAGDYLKFVETTSYVVGLMLTGVRDFPAQMGADSASSDFSAEAEFGLRWLLKMWDDDTGTLYYQVGIGIDFATSDVLSDHDFWRLPQDDDTATPTSAPGFAGVTQAQLVYITHRPVFVAGAAGMPVSPNLAGRLAADFALCFQVFRVRQPALGQRCLRAARHVYALADGAPRQRLLTTSPFGFYPETVWQDDLEWGATELYLAERAAGGGTGAAATYLGDAARWAAAYLAQGSFDSLNLYDVAGLAHFELYRAIALAGEPALAVSRAALLANLGTLLTVHAPPGGDPFDSLYTWSEGDSASHVAGLSVLASEIAYLQGAASTATARRQADALLGANAWGVSFIIGAGSTFPYCPQHQVANLVGSHGHAGPVLAGGVVEGPNASASSGELTAMLPCGRPDTYHAFDANGALYEDFVQSYTTNEPALDLTASSMLMFSWRIGGGPGALP